MLHILCIVDVSLLNNLIILFSRETFMIWSFTSVSCLIKAIEKILYNNSNKYIIRIEMVTRLIMESYLIEIENLRIIQWSRVFVGWYEWTETKDRK